MHRWLLVATLLLLGASVSLRPTVGNAGEVELTCNGLEATIVAWLGDDEIVFGTGGNDVIIVTFMSGNPPQTGESTVYAGAGNDTICVFGGYTTVYGGSGNDWIYGEGPDSFENTFLSPNLRNGFAKGTSVFGKGLFGEAGADYVAFGPVIDGGAGNDTLHFAEYIYGGAGNDRLENGAYCDGGTGTDTAVGCGSSTRVEKFENSPN